MHYLEVPKKIVQQLGGKLNMRLLCTVNHAISFQCGLMALGEGRAYISLSSKRMKKLGVCFGDEVSVSLQADTSVYGMEMPEELSELLSQDEEGNRRFHLLTKGRQRYIIHYVSSVKSTQLRIDRAIMLIENLKRLPPGKESFRAMLGLEN
jgi:hypothetical protein